MIPFNNATKNAIVILVLQQCYMKACRAQAQSLWLR